MSWTFAKGPFGMYRVGQLRAKTFVPIVGFISAVDAERALASLNHVGPYVPPAPLPMPPTSTSFHPKVTVKSVRGKFRIK